MSYDNPDIGEAIAIHDTLTHEFGGGPGLRDKGALTAALMRPQLGYYDNLNEEGPTYLSAQKCVAHEAAYTSGYGVPKLTFWVIWLGGVAWAADSGCLA